MKTETAEPLRAGSWPRFVERWLTQAREDAVLHALGTGCNLEFGMRCGEQPLWLRLADGIPVEHALELEGRATDFVLAAPVEVWEQFWAPVPPPTYHALYALAMRAPEFTIEGDEERFAQSVHVVAPLLARARPARRPPVVGAQPDELEAITGRYLRVQLPGGTAPIYVEEAGTGPALLCLHTAGADSRQYHGLLGHPELRSRWRIVAFDLPQHGRSGTPEGMLEGAWRLDTDRYVAIIRSVVARLGLVHPVVLGCSMGGQICLELAYRHPDEFAAVIACEAAALVPGRKVMWAKHPRVNQALFVPEWIDGLMGPGTASARRAAVRHAYAQAAYGIFHGDIEFYSGDWDARDRLSQIDTTRCPVHMLTGQYDYSCTPTMSRETAESIQGATFQELAGLGHFPMAEDPAAFLDYLSPILERVRA